MLVSHLAKAPWFLMALLIGHDTTLLLGEARQTTLHQVSRQHQIKPVRRQAPKAEVSITRRVAITTTTKMTVCSNRDDIKFHPTILLTLQGRPGKMTNSDIVLLQRSMIRAYNMVVNCGRRSDLTGAFLRLQQVNITRIAAATKKSTGVSGSTTQTFQVVATTQGDCRGCKTNPFRLWRIIAKGTTPSQPRGMKQQQPTPQPHSQQHFPPTISKNSNGQGGGGSSPNQAGNAQSKPPKPAMDCTCSVPFKSSFLQAINTMVPLPPSVDKVLDMDDQQAMPTACPKVKTFTTYLTVDFVPGIQDPFDLTTSQAQAQYQILQQAVLRAYNKANGLNKENICDPFFTVVTDVKVEVSPDSGYGATGLNRRRHLSLLSAFTFLIQGSCQGCSSRPSLFNDDMNNQRRGRRISIWQLDDMEETPQELGEVVKASSDINIPEMHHPQSSRFHRQLAINDTCSCPKNTTQLRRPTMNDYLQALDDQLEALQTNGSLTIVMSAQNTFQVNPVNCTAQVTYFNSIVAVDFEGNVSSFSQDQTTALGRTFQSTYNSLAQDNCDPFFRTVQTVQFVGTASNDGRRRDLRDSTNRNQGDDGRQLLLSLSTILIFVSGRCRGCSDTTPLFDDGNSRRLGELLSGPPLTLAIQHRKSGVRKAQFQRTLQEDVSSSDQCFCNFDSNAARAPTLHEFRTAYKTTVASGNATSTLTVTTVDKPRNISVTFPPTEAPMQRTRIPTLAPTEPLPSIKPSNHPIVATHFPTFLPTTTTVSSDSPSLSPSATPS